MGADVLVLAAPDLTLTGENAGKVNAKYVVELGNGVTNSDADQILQEKKVVLLPDILANAGGVMVSGYEYLQGRQWEQLTPGAAREWWAKDYVMGLLTRQITAAAAAVYALSVEHEISLRRAADAKALKTLDRAYRVVRIGEKDPGSHAFSGGGGRGHGQQQAPASE
jgi:glutamate dehydrogenase (NAD(P)+)